jgi:hypothetical protein
MIELKESPKDLAEYVKLQHTIETRDSMACGKHTWNGQTGRLPNRRLAGITAGILFGSVAALFIK